MLASTKQFCSRLASGFVHSQIKAAKLPELIESRGFNGLEKEESGRSWKSMGLTRYICVSLLTSLSWHNKQQDSHIRLSNI
jgi:hypothetical protein